MALPDVLGTKVGRLVAEHFADPRRLAALGASPVHPVRRRSRAAGPPAGRRPAGGRRPGRVAVPGRCGRPAGAGCGPGAAGRPGHPGPGRGDPDGGAGAGQPVRAAADRARLGCGAGRQLRRRGRRPGPLARPRQLYRASGLSPVQYESAGKRRDGAISREGSVELRRALIDLGSGCGSPTRPPNATGRAAGPRQARRGHRLRDGAPGQQDRLRHGPRPDRLPARPLGLTTPRRLPRSRPTCRSAGAVNLERPQRSEDERG